MADGLAPVGLYCSWMPDSHRWFVVLDSMKARLVRGSRTAKGSPHLDEMASLTTTFVAGEHHRPDRLAPGRSAGTSHEHEEALAHFAREVAPWLQKELTARGVASCAMFAPTHMVGALRKVITKPLAALLQEHALELANLPLAQLAAHPRIQELLVK
jgi:protein required for attachment to host cells